MSHMRWTANALFLLAATLPLTGQSLTRSNIAVILDFENGTPGKYPAGWAGNADHAIVIDDQVAHGGKHSARIDRSASSPGTISTILAAIPLDFASERIELRGFLRLENVADYVALWLRVDDASGTAAFATLQGQGIKGTADWKEYSISVPNPALGRQVVFGFFLAGAGRAWVDDMQLLADGKPVAAAPARSGPFDKDREFDLGSGVKVSALTPVQVRNLATLAKVWGFLKYHHPAVTAGRHHWDYELFRTMPQVLNAGSQAAGSAVLSEWIARLGPVEECTRCATLDETRIALRPDWRWLGDAGTLGAGLAETLRSIQRNRTPTNAQFYVSLAGGAGNPLFDNELNYPTFRLPDPGYQLLALFRFWNMVQYFSPNREIMSDVPEQEPEYWYRVLEESIPSFALATDQFSYQQALLRFIAKINDTHANLWSSLAARPPVGACWLPVEVRFVEGLPLVIRHTSTTQGPASGLLPGDILVKWDGRYFDDYMAEWKPFYADSNEPTRLRDMARYLTRGACGAAEVEVWRDNQMVAVKSVRVASSAIDRPASATHDLQGATFQMLRPDVAYLKLSSVKAAEAASYVRSAAGTKGLIIDIRNYPSEFVVFALGQLLVSERTEFARFTFGDITNPGAFHWGAPVVLVPQQPRYTGSIVILVDEVSQSQAEYTTMAFRSAPGAVVIGSTTAGADGNVSTVPLPGGHSSYISGLGVFFPDKSPTQRIGIIPDIVITPSIEGIKAGRDELIEVALRWILGTP